MDIKKIKNLDLKSFFLLTAILFLLFSTVLIGVYISNKIKEGRYIGQEAGVKNTITVSGTGEIYAKPDLAIIDFSVITEAKTVGEALDKNTEKMNAIIKAVSNQGIDDKDLKTTNFNIYPRYEWYERSEFYPQGKRVLVGYEVRQTLEVKIRDIGKISQIIDSAVNAGANQVGGLSFTIDKQDEVKKQAREKAIKEAKAKAKEIASQLGVRLVKITGFSESAVIPIPRPFNFKGEAMGMGGGDAPQIETGENKIEVTVNITYEIR